MCVNNKLEKISFVSGNEILRLGLKLCQDLCVVQKEHSLNGQDININEGKLEDIVQGIGKLSTAYRTELQICTSQLMCLGKFAMPKVEVRRGARY